MSFPLTYSAFAARDNLERWHPSTQMSIMLTMDILRIFSTQYSDKISRTSDDETIYGNVSKYLFELLLLQCE